MSRSVSCWRSASVPAAICLAVLGAAPASAQVAPQAEAAQVIMDDAIYTFVGFDELERAPGAVGRPLGFDADAWVGGDFVRLRLRLEGEHDTEDGGGGAVQGRALYSRVVSPFWNLEGGVRVDGLYGPGDDHARAHLAVGIAGLAPYWFEVESFLFVSQAGDVSATVEAAYDLLVTQRLVLEPELEVGVALQDVPDFGIESGVHELELGARLRYEILRELAPYAGWVWSRHTGDPEHPGEARSEGAFVAGLRWWY